MTSYSLSHLSDQTLLRDLAALVARDHATTATLLAHIAEVDERRLFLPAGYPSMFAYCVQELHLSEDAAFKRIRAARTARQIPAVFHAVAEGRLHLSAVVLLAPCLTPGNSAELIEAATHKSKSEIEALLANRFPRPDLSTLVRAMPAPRSQVSTPQRVPEPLGQLAPGPVAETESTLEVATTPAAVETVIRPPRIAPLAPRRFALQLTMSQEMHDKLRHARELLGHQVPSGDVAQVLERALDALISKLEKRKFATTSAPRRPGSPASDRRYVPAHVRRAVRARDGGQCTFVSEKGQRCPARTRLEFDHVQEVARGGSASAANVRLRCRAHNQFEAERTFGVEFMRHKRMQAQDARVRRRFATSPGAPPSACSPPGR